MKATADLARQLQDVDGRGYPAYKGLQGAYRFSDFELSIDHVQGDPFASPSKLTVSMAMSVAGFPSEYYDEAHKRIRLQDYLTREFGNATRKYSGKARGSGKSGDIRISHPGQEVLERTAVQIIHASEKNPYQPETQIRGDKIAIRFEVGLPAQGRRIAGRECQKILLEYIPECVKQSLLYASQDKNKLKRAIELSEDQYHLRSFIQQNDLVAFVADGSILPRESGVSGRPMRDAVPFASPESMKVTVDLPNKGSITGMGIQKGVTLIVGGGYHGKSTLLKALELGIYDHVPGDGREYVVTDETTVKLRAEDGRSISNVDVSFFINHLPNGKDTHAFSTEDASGSTSQAANVIEGMEAGAECFLIDEDTSATNFMLRDDLMQRVIAREKEPITPYVERTRQIYEDFGISTVLVAGSSGAYFFIADAIIQMDAYIPKDITEEVQTICQEFTSENQNNAQEAGGVSHMDFHLPYKRPEWNRTPFTKKTDHSDRDRMKIRATGRDTVQVGRCDVDVRYVEQLVDSEQLKALGYMMKYALDHKPTQKPTSKPTLRQLVDQIYDQLQSGGLMSLCGKKWASMALPRKQELFALMNRYRDKNTFGISSR